MTISKYIKMGGFNLALIGILIFVYMQAKQDLVNEMARSSGQNIKILNEHGSENGFGGQKLKSLFSDTQQFHALSAIKKSEEKITHLSEALNQMNFSMQNVTETLAEKGLTIDENVQLSQKEQDKLQEETHRQTYELYATTLESEQKDAQWSEPVEGQLVQSLDAAKGNLYTDEIDCRTTLCRLEISKNEAARDEDMLESLETQINWQGQVNMIYDPNTGKATVYLAREDHTLPVLNKDN
ncbi:hypothetical protein [Methylicorpusculum sp.]|uniref:hypothetical protein n=1 Tax=Methylicorpusculum sp. TaxID=2713644 RepID=UPI0027257CCF|nr:hypothetical protein [Methylicorpusculum sp.]MDO8844779.1 hypothetical protein [Methylicorpusculum sp.]